jgi:formylglycine-generating enzyme required for sulfatase activity
VVIETVHVGNPGNVGELSGGGEQARICGAVAYTYNIAKYEVTAGQYCEFLNAVAATDTYGLYDSSMWSNSYYGCKIQRTGASGSYKYSVAADWANRPVNYISWGDAARFANWLHNGQPTGVQDLTTTEDGSYFLNGATTNAALMAVGRKWADATWVIPTEDEWYKAAYHKNDGVTGNYWNYPTSSDSPPGYVKDSGNLSGTGTPFVEGGTDPGNYATYNGDGGTEGIGSPYYRTVVGEWENSASPYGTFDQGGNVREWNEAVVYGVYRGVRGGSFRYYGYLLHASHRDYVYDPPYEGSGFGFRVALVPEPAAILMLTLAGVGVLRRKRSSG